VKAAGGRLVGWEALVKSVLFSICMLTSGSEIWGMKLYYSMRLFVRQARNAASAYCLWKEAVDDRKPVSLKKKYSNANVVNDG